MSDAIRAALTCVAALAVLSGCTDRSDREPVPDMVEIEDAGVSFAMPEGWIELDPAKAREAVDDEDLMAELVERHGPDTERFGPVRFFIEDVGHTGSELDFVASAKGVHDNVLSTVKVNVLDEMPSVAELERSFGRLPYRYLEATEVDTPVGPAILVQASPIIGTPGEKRDRIVHWAVLTVDAGAILEAGFLTDDRSEAEDLATGVADSLRRTPEE